MTSLHLEELRTNMISWAFSHLWLKMFWHLHLSLLALFFLLRKTCFFPLYTPTILAASWSPTLLLTSEYYAICNLFIAFSFSSFAPHLIGLKYTHMSPIIKNNNSSSPNTASGYHTSLASFYYQVSILNQVIHPHSLYFLITHSFLAIYHLLPILMKPPL